MSEELSESDEVASSDALKHALVGPRETEIDSRSRVWAHSRTASMHFRRSGHLMFSKRVGSIIVLRVVFWPGAFRTVSQPPLLEWAAQ